MPTSSTRSTASYYSYFYSLHLKIYKKSPHERRARTRRPWSFESKGRVPARPASRAGHRRPQEHDADARQRPAAHAGQGTAPGRSDRPQRLASPPSSRARTRREGGLTVGAKSSLRHRRQRCPATRSRSRRADNHWAEITAGKVDYRIVGMPDRDFPKVPDHREVAARRVDAEHAARDDRQDAVLGLQRRDALPPQRRLLRVRRQQGAHGLDRRSPAVARSSARLPGGPKLTAGVIIPKKGLLEIKRVARRGDAQLQGRHQDAVPVPRAGDIALAVKLIDAQFPPYEQVIPKDARARSSTVDRSRFIDALKRAQLMSSETRGVKLSPRRRTASRITSDNPDLGEVTRGARGRVRRRAASPSASIPKYVARAARRRCRATRSRIELGGELDPVLVRPLDRRRTTSASSCRCASERRARSAPPCAQARGGPQPGAAAARAGPALQRLRRRQRPGQDQPARGDLRGRTLRSFRTRRLADLIAFGAREARLARAWSSAAARARSTSSRSRRAAAQVRLDGKAVRPLARYFGGFNVVLFTPEDLAVPRGARPTGGASSTARCSTRRPSTSATAQDYDKVLQQRNALLAQLARAAQPATRRRCSTVYDQQLAELGARASSRRGARSSTSSHRASRRVRGDHRSGHRGRPRATRRRSRARSATRRRSRRAARGAGGSADARPRARRDLGRPAPRRPRVRARRPATRGSVRVAGPAARDRAGVEDRRARAARARRTASRRSCCSTTSRASSTRAQRVSVRVPRAQAGPVLHHDDPPQARSC